MSSEEDRAKHSRRRKRNVLAKIINDTKGPFSIKVVDPRKGEYKREKMRVKEVVSDVDYLLGGKEHYDETNEVEDIDHNDEREDDETTPRGVL